MDPTGLAPVSLGVNSRMLTAYTTGPKPMWGYKKQKEPLRRAEVLNYDTQ